MSAVDRRRYAILESLLRLQRTPAELQEALAAVSWDAEEELVTLTRRDVRDVLQRALQGRIPLTDVEVWAELIEGREDIGRESGSEDELNEAIFELANPSLTDKTVETLIRRWTARLA